MTSQLTRSLVVLAFAFMSYGSRAWSETLVNANEAVVLSDDIYKRTTEVIHAGGGEPGPAEGGTPVPTGGGELVPTGGGTPIPAEGGKPKAGNDKNRSGLGDGTNPGLGSGRDNSPNEGTKNPNRAHRD